MRKKIIEKLEETVINKNADNTVILWEGINKPFKYNNNSYENKEQLQSDYPNVEFDFLTIVWEDGNIAPIENQTDKIIIETLEEFEMEY
jgi:hypothetical protein